MLRFALGLLTVGCVLLSGSAAVLFALGAWVIIVSLGTRQRFSWVGRFFTLGALALVLFSPLILLLLPLESYEIKSRNAILRATNIQNPLLLVLGLGWFGGIITRLRAASLAYVQPIHNSVWEFTISNGLAPTACLVGLLAGTFRKFCFWRSTHLIALLVSVALMASLDHYLVTQTQTLYAALLALAVVLKQHKINPVLITT